MKWLEVRGSYAALIDEWGRTGFADTNYADAGDYFAVTGDAFYGRLKHSTRANVGCDARYLGVSPDVAGQCGTGDNLRAAVVSFDDAPVVSVTLYEAADFAAQQCYWWRIKIESGPCAGYYLDQNHGLNDLQFETHETQWT